MANFLKLNSEKTEVLLSGCHAQLAKIDLSIMNTAGVNVTLSQISSKPWMFCLTLE